MLTREMNERLARVGPGTPGGNLMRYYWHPIAATIELDENPVKRVRLLGEDLVLYRDRSGTYGLIADTCPHRGASLEFGIPEAEGLRCMYHGWRFGADGQCLEQPGEPWNSTFKDSIKITAYRAQELGGLVFAYLGNEPAPLLPRYDLLVLDNTLRHIALADLPCNWLQCTENSLDPIHVEWLHGYYMDYMWRDRKKSPLQYRKPARHAKIGFDLFEHGIVKRRVLEGQPEGDEWFIGHPIIFPYINRQAEALLWRTPVDDTHTYHILYQTYRTGLPVKQERVPVYHIPLKDETGRDITENLLVQDFAAWASQGEIAPRDREHLGQSDIGVIMHRQLLAEQIDRVEAGLEPTLEIYRDPAKNQCIEIPEALRPFIIIGGIPSSLRVQEPWAWEFFDQELPEVIAYLQESERLAKAGELTPPPPVPPIPIGAIKHRSVQILPPDVESAPSAAADAADSDPEPVGAAG